MDCSPHQKIIIVGAGLTGTLLGILLAKRGFTVDIFEQREDLRKSNLKEGRSINLTMGVRAWKALKEAEVDKPIQKISIPLYQRTMHSIDNLLTHQSYGGDQAIYAICRFELNKILLNTAEEYKNIHFHFRKKCMDLDLDSMKILYKDTHNGERYKISSDLIIGADGAYSSIRNALLKTPMFSYSQSYIDYGYKEITISSMEENQFLHRNNFHIWARGKCMLIASPDLEDTFTATLFLPFKGNDSFEELNNERKVLNFFSTQFPDIVPYTPGLVEQFFANSPSPIVSIKCNPWTHKDKILLIGDSAHAIPPFYGQGMNSAFEDCSILINLLDRYGVNWPIILSKFQNERISHTNALSELTMDNFIEIRDHVARSEFLFRMKIENEIQRQYPEKWKPLYTMVAFTHMPYTQVLERGKKTKNYYRPNYEFGKYK